MISPDGYFSDFLTATGTSSFWPPGKQDGASELVRPKLVFRARARIVRGSSAAWVHASVRTRELEELVDTLTEQVARQGLRHLGWLGVVAAVSKQRGEPGQHKDIRNSSLPLPHAPNTLPASGFRAATPPRLSPNNPQRSAPRRARLACRSGAQRGGGIAPKGCEALRGSDGRGVPGGTDPAGREDRHYLSTAV